MSGIRSYGAYIPYTRLPFSVIGGKAPKEGGPERSVAWNDEDSITLAVTAGANCLADLDRNSIDGLFFATTTYPMKEKEAAAFIAKALDLRRDIRTADFSSSLRAGTHALQAASDAVKAGSAKNVLVIAADCRTGAPGSGIERSVGDGAAAFLVGTEGVIAEINDYYAISNELVDLWRKDSDEFVHTWEDRFTLMHGYRENTLAAIQGVLEKSGSSAEQYAKLVLFGPDARSHGALPRSAGFKPEQVQDPFFGKLGNTGTAFALMQLVAALEAAAAGDRLLVANYGDGADATTLTATSDISKLPERRGMAYHLARRRTVEAYGKYLKARGLDQSEYENPDTPGLSATVHFRERDQEISLHCQICNQCKVGQYPIERICGTCYAKDDFTHLRLSDLTGQVLTYTFDFFFPTPDPPTIVTIVKFENGCQVHMQMTDANPKDVVLDQPVEFVLRKIHEVGQRPNYFWKCTPSA